MTALSIVSHYSWFWLIMIPLGIAALAIIWAFLEGRRLKKLEEKKVKP